MEGSGPPRRFVSIVDGKQLDNITNDANPQIVEPTNGAVDDAPVSSMGSLIKTKVRNSTPASNPGVVPMDSNADRNMKHKSMGQQMQRWPPNNDGKPQAVGAQFDTSVPKVVKNTTSGGTELATETGGVDEEDTESNELSNNRGKDEAADPEEPVPVAREVEDLESVRSQRIGVAMEDGGFKPSNEVHRRYWHFVAASAVVLLIALGVGLGVGLSSRSSPEPNSAMPSTTPSSSPVTLIETEYRERIEKIFPDAAVEGTPHDMALKWIINDSGRISPEDIRLIQRYTLALFWFSTTDNGQRPWLSCNPVVGSNDTSCIFQELKRFKDDNFGRMPSTSTQWISSENECLWAGVLCHESFVVGVALPGQEITGPFPKDILSIDTLGSVELQYNDFTGTIPEVTVDVELVLFDLSGNKLTGRIPSSLFEHATNLERLDLGENMLNGTVSSAIAKLTRLKGLYLGKNDLSGPLPDLGSFKDLSFSRLDSNQFTGTISNQIGDATGLIELLLYNNSISGTIPSSIGKPEGLLHIRLEENQLSGTIPEELYSLQSLQRLALHRNNLSGTLSSKATQLSDLEVFTVSRNQLTGTLPPGFGNIFTLRLLWFHLNLLSGDVPVDYCSNFDPDGRLESMFADCFPVDASPQQCVCCNRCCDRGTGTCSVRD